MESCSSTDPVCKLAVQIVRDMFGGRAAIVAANLAGFGTQTLGQVVGTTSLGGREVRACLAVLLQHGMVTAACDRKPPVVDYTIQLDKIVESLQYPIYLHLVKTNHGDQAEAMIEDVIRQGADTASNILFRTARRMDVTQGDPNNEGGVLPAGDQNIAPSVFELNKKLKLLVSSDILERCPSLIPSVPDNDSNDASTDEVLDKSAYVEPDLKALAEALKAGHQAYEGVTPDSGVYWRMNCSVMAQMLRDKLIVQAATRRTDQCGGQIVSSLLSVVSESSKAWAPVSTHIAHHTIQEKVAADHGKEGQAYRYLDQYLRLLSDDKTRFVDRVGDSGGGQYSVDMEHIIRQLAQASLDCVVLEKFGSKALRIFRYVQHKKFVEEGSLQSVVMIPTKETKMLTYQLLENHFLHLQELRKTLASNAPSKAFCLFYVNFEQVVRNCVALCHKAIFNAKKRAEIEAENQARLLDKQERIESIITRLQAEGGTEEQLTEVAEMLTPFEKETVGKVHRQLGKLSSSRMQVAETLFILKTHLHYRQAS